MKVVVTVLIFFDGVAMAGTIDWESARQRCLSEGSEADKFAVSRNHIDRDLGRVPTHRDTVKHFSERYVDEGSIRWHLQTVRGAMNEETQRMGRPEPYSVFNLCILEAALTQLGSSGVPVKKNTQRSSDEGVGTGGKASGEGDVNQSIALAQQNQAEAEEKRKKDGRRRNRPDLVASDCLTPDTGPRDHGFSVFKNSCSEPVEYTYCTVGAQEGSLAAFVSCTNRHGNRGGGAGSVRAGGESAAPMRGASEVHWLACKRPARAITRGFENGKLVGDCIDLGA